MGEGAMHWGNWWAVTRADFDARGVRALPGLFARAALGLAVDQTWQREAPQALDRPVWIIVGHQRSGTTMFHRQLVEMPGAIGMRLHEQLLPIPALQRLLLRQRRPSWLDALQTRLLGRHDDLHRIRLHEVEEDEVLLYTLFRSTMNVDDRLWADGEAPRLEFEGRVQMHARAIAQLLERQPAATRYVGKNPHFTDGVPALRAAIPGVRIVQLVRHPAAAIASRLGQLQRFVRYRNGAEAKLSPERSRQIYQRSLAMFRGGLNTADLDLRYVDLVRDPVAAVRRVHAEFGGPAVGPHEAEAISERAGRLKKARPATYVASRLEDFGLDYACVYEDLREVYDHWGFDEVPKPLKRDP